MRPIKVPDPLQVQMQNLQLTSQSLSSIRAHFRFHIIIIHALRRAAMSWVRFWARECRRSTIHLQSVSKNADGIIICCWSGTGDWGQRTEDWRLPLPLPLQVEYLNARAGLYLFNAVDCFVFSVSFPSAFRLKALIYVLKVRNPCGQVNFRCPALPCSLPFASPKGSRGRQGIIFV